MTTVERTVWDKDEGKYLVGKLIGRTITSDGLKLSFRDACFVKKTDVPERASLEDTLPALYAASKREDKSFMGDTFLDSKKPVATIYVESH